VMINEPAGLRRKTRDACSRANYGCRCQYRHDCIPALVESSLIVPMKRAVSGWNCVPAGKICGESVAQNANLDVVAVLLRRLGLPSIYPVDLSQQEAVRGIAKQ
jgi:hypothetical protein